jgi:Domain of unknown function (DUF2357)
MGSPPSSELARLRDIVHGVDGRPGLATILPMLQGRHHRVLLRVEHWTSGDLARHPEPREMARSMRKIGNIDSHGKLVRTFEMRRFVTEDVYENRFVRHVLEEVSRRLSALPDEEAGVLGRELNAAKQLTPFLRSAGRLGHSAAEPTAVLVRDPLYRAVYEIWRLMGSD